MKEKLIEFKSLVFKILILLSITALYGFLFSDFFVVYDPAIYVISATFLTYVYVLREKFKQL